MSKRLQIVVADSDLETYRQLADAAGMTVSEWARQALGVARREASSGDVEGKLAVIRRAARRDTDGREVDVERMLAETEAGRIASIEAGLAGAGGA